MTGEKYTLYYFDKYFDDIRLHKKSGQKKILQKILSLLKELVSTPKEGKGKPEELKGFGNRVVWSRRIDKKHRLVYEIVEDDKIVRIISAYGHYADK